MKHKLNLLLLSGLILMIKTSNAQTPGGVSSQLKLWVRPNSGVTTTGSLVDTWTYVNDGTKSFTSSGVNRPTLVTQSLNFQPTISFTGSHFMDGPTGVNAPIPAGDDSYAAFVVWRSASNSTFQRIWSQRNVCGPCFNHDAVSLATWDNSPPGPGAYGDETGSPPFSHTMTRNYTTSEWNISQLNLLAQATSDLEIVDNRNINTPLALNTDPGGAPNGQALRNLGNSVHRIGAQFDATQFLNGNVAEIIVYDRSISGVERNQIFSYLSLKYGIPLGTNIVSSAGTVVWNATTNAIYNNSVFGIARDNTSGLLVSQSNSYVTGNGNGSGQTGEANIVLSNPTALTTDQSFLMIGTDNGALTESSTELPGPAAGSLRLGREWKVQKTGNTGFVTLAIDLNGITVTGTNVLDFRLIIDEDGNGNLANGTTRYYTPNTFSGGVLTFQDIRLNNNEVFALITSATGGTPLPVVWESFIVKIADQKAHLTWEVSQNESASHYEIEHSVDGAHFKTVGNVENKEGVFGYSYIFNGLQNGNNYFRLKQVDLDGKYVYSKILQVKWADILVQMMNNPIFSGFAEMDINVKKAGRVSVELQSINGNRILTQQNNLSIGTNRLKIDINKAPAGSYILKLQIDEFIWIEKIVKL